MKVLNVRNVHEALPRALQLLEQEGQRRESRNGPVLQYPCPVATVYQHPEERVIFWPQRDANPFFHLFEGLWMLQGRNDVASIARYNSNFKSYSDDGETFHGAYGHRWRQWPRNVPPGTFYGDTLDQLPIIAKTLRENPDDRRCVLDMWNADRDLGKQGKDFPCNLTATFQRGLTGELNLTVFCRSNDIVWGAYGANAVHFSMLLEYMAAWIGCPMGTYTQISVNWHGYVEILEKMKDLPRPDHVGFIYNPYLGERIDVTNMYDPTPRYTEVQPRVRLVRMFTLMGDEAVEQFDQELRDLLQWAEDPTAGWMAWSSNPFIRVCYKMLWAHHLWRTLPTPDRFVKSIHVLSEADMNIDWILSGVMWLSKRHMEWEQKNGVQSLQRSN